MISKYIDSKGGWPCSMEVYYEWRVFQVRRERGLKRKVCMGKQEEEQLFAMISKVWWCIDDQDRLVWVGDDPREYIVKSGYDMLNKVDQMQTSEVFKLLWTLKIAPSVMVCAWRLLVYRLPTKFNLAKRGMHLMNLSCPLCQECIESGQHLFAMCKVAQKFGINVKGGLEMLLSNTNLSLFTFRASV